jgi:predicted nicotinamide N-methyase
MTSIAGFVAVLEHVPVGADSLALWRVADLARHVDRDALLAGDDPPEPPYWAHLWSGAHVLAIAVPPDAGRVVELGCGLGLPGLVAARRGARVTFVDRVPAALAFVRRSATANALDGDFVVADFTGPGVGGRFDLVLAAEVLYDRACFSDVAAAIRDHLAPGGRALLTDAARTDTRPFYAALDAAGLRWRATEHPVREEGLPVTVRLVEIAIS